MWEVGLIWYVNKVQGLILMLIFILHKIDERLDENNYNKPGLGDAGDRAFITN